MNKELIDDFVLFMMGSGIKAVTVNTYIRNLRAFLYWCADNSYLERIIPTMLIIINAFKLQAHYNNAYCKIKTL